MTYFVSVMNNDGTMGSFTPASMEDAQDLYNVFVAKGALCVAWGQTGQGVVNFETVS